MSDSVAAPHPRGRSEVTGGSECRLRARGFYVAERLDFKALPSHETVGLGPLTVRVGDGGYAALFRYGAVVLIGVGDEDEEAFLRGLSTSMRGRFERPSSEELQVVLDPTREERVDEEGMLSLRDASVERLQVVAVALAKSAALAHYEAGVEHAFEQLEPLAERMSGGRRPGARYEELLAQLGDALLTQARTVGGVQVSEKPEITWDAPELDRLYERLASEYELGERDRALTRKTDLISTSTGVYLDLMQTRQTLRVEWYIVILIVLEILLILYDIFLRS